jgi:hypothetical protein
VMDLDRRRFVGDAAAFAFRPTAAAKEAKAHRFRTADAEIDMTIEFHDGYARRGFWFDEHMSNRRCCSAAGGEDEGRSRVLAFRGSLAIARCRLRPRAHPEAEPLLREYVRTIDRDARLPDHPPFERSIVLKRGAGSELQTFPHEPVPKDGPLFHQRGPRYLYRQDLFLEPQRAPSLVAYGKHALASIRVLDLIPSGQTSVEKR